MFLSALPGKVTLVTVTPRGLCHFLIFKDKDGKTQVHCNSCKFIGQQSSHPCDCHRQLSYKTVDSYIGKLRSIFHAKGRDGEWDKRLGLGNPAADKSVKNYFRVVPQATPFFVDKLTMLPLHLQRELEKFTSAVQRFIIAHNQAYFNAAFFGGDRPGDVGLKFYVFQIMTVFCLIMFGGGP